MQPATFTELRHHAKVDFDAVETGDSVQVLRNGKPIADIMPSAPSQSSWKRRAAESLTLKGMVLSSVMLHERNAAAT